MKVRALSMGKALAFAAEAWGDDFDSRNTSSVSERSALMTSVMISGHASLHIAYWSFSEKREHRPWFASSIWSISLL